MLTKYHSINIFELANTSKISRLAIIHFYQIVTTCIQDYVWQVLKLFMIIFNKFFFLTHRRQATPPPPPPTHTIKGIVKRIDRYRGAPVLVAHRPPNKIPLPYNPRDVKPLFLLKVTHTQAMNSI